LDERKPHQTPTGSTMTLGKPARIISSAMTTAVLVLPAPRLPRLRPGRC
jgi:hypothetical protein